MKRRPLTIVHVTASAGGGAGRAARRISDSLGALGHDSTLLTADPAPGERRIVIEPKLSGLSETQKLARRFLGDFLNHKYIERLRDLRHSNTLFSSGMDGHDLAAIPLLRAADIVHIHFLPRIGTPNALRQILALGKPVVWTLHDQWAFTGGCHYSGGCRQFEATCAECPQLRRDPWRLPALLQAEKAASFADGALTLITPSDWMGDCARASAVFLGARIQTIRNPIDLDRFRPLTDDQRHDLRRRLGMAEDDLVLIAGANSNVEHRKGFDLLEEGLRRFSAEQGFTRLSHRVWLLTFGSHPTNISIEGLESLALGPIEDDEALAAILGIGDLVVLPSREDNDPNIMVEALACGTPVAGFARGGLAERITDGENGLLMGEAPEADSLVALLARVAEAPTMLAEMRSTARASVAPRHGLVPSGMAYEAVYKSMLPLSRLLSATVPAVAASPAPIRLDRLFRRVPVMPITIVGPAFAADVVEGPLLDALRAYVDLKGEPPNPDGFIAEHTDLAVPQEALAAIIAEAQACRAALETSNLDEEDRAEPAPLSRPSIAAPGLMPLLFPDDEAVAKPAPGRRAPPPPGERAATPRARSKPAPNVAPPPNLTFRKAILLDCQQNHPALARLAVTLWSNDTTLPLEGWSVCCEGELLPSLTRRSDNALIIEFERATASPAGTSFDILSPAIQGFAERDEARLLAQPIIQVSPPHAPLPVTASALAAEGWDGFYAPEPVDGRWMRWMSPRGHVLLPRWSGRATLVVEGFLRPTMLTENHAKFSIGRTPLTYTVESMPGTVDPGEGFWRLKAELPLPPRALPPVLSISADPTGWPRTPGDTRDLTLLLASIRIDS